VDDAGRAHAEGRLDDALARVAAAAAIDPRHAQLAFLQGRLLAEAGRWKEAREAFERARDEDICPLRALGPTSGIVRDVAAERAVPVVDFEAWADETAEHGIPGDDLFLDHVHPTAETNRLLALLIIEEMVRDGIVTPAAGWGDAAVAEVARRVEGSLDEEAHARALMNLSKVLGWAGKLQESDRLAGQAVELYPDSSMIQYNAGLTAHLLGRKDQAMAHYRRAVELQPDADEAQGNLGVLLEEAGQLDEAIQHYRMAIRFARTSETATRNSANLAQTLMVKGYQDYAAGRLPESLAHLTEAAELAPGEPEILGRLGIAQLAAGRTGDAVASFENALRGRPDDPALSNRLALALALDGRPDRAEEAYRRALALDPGVADLPDNLFRVLRNMGRTDLVTDLQRRLAR
jgi:tetratricopeptide (TPR) repeat protein